MKKFKYVFLSTMAVALSFSVSACGNNAGGGEVAPVFSYDFMFESGKDKRIFVGEDPENLLILETNAPETTEYTATYNNSGDKDYFTFVKNPDGKSFTITPIKATPVSSAGVPQTVGIRIKEKSVAGKGKLKSFYIEERHDKANTGYNFSADTEMKAEALGKLEAYAMKNFLTGITLFENGGYQRFSSRVEERAPTYVSGYGFGVLTEGKLNPDKPLTGLDPLDPYKDYYRTATSSNPGNINGWKATGSQIGDLFGYITSSFYGTKLNKGKTGYVWYPLLANDPDYSEDLDNAGPTPLDGKATDLIHKKWRIYVKTGDIKYRSLDSTYDNRPVVLDDYIQAFRTLLTQKADLIRGSELATDTSYGFKGAISYFRNTKDATDELAEAAWTSMVNDDLLGIKGGHDDTKGDYIDFEFINPIDQFTAMYTLSSSLYSPIPKDFLKSIGGGSWIVGAGNYGTKNGSNVKNNVINVGPYFLQEWDTQEIVFTQNRDWFEYVETKDTDHPRYRIPGVHMEVVTNAQDHDDAIFNEFNSGKLDSTGIPASRFSEKVGTDVPTKGDATFKLNVNALDQTRWDDIFWSNNPKYKDVKKPQDHYNVKKWMSNLNFLNGLFWSIDRKTFAESRGVNPSYNYFADAYLSDPRGGVSYNTSQAHKDAEDAFDPVLRSSGTYGYSKAKASSYFDKAVKELKLPLGTKNNPTTIEIDISWMYSNDETTYGQEIANCFTAAFNNENVGGGCIQLKVNHPKPGTDWQEVYEKHLQVGCFDLGFGAISGNTLNPLNFLEVLKTDNSSGFTLNWGAETSEVDDNNPITFDVPVLDEEGNKIIEGTDPVTGKDIIKKETKEWSFDALWAAADHGTVVRDGEVRGTVDHGYTTAPKKGDQQVNFLNEGAEMDIPFAFVDIDKEGASFEIDRVQLFLVGYGYLAINPDDINYTLDEHGNIINIHVEFDSTTTYKTVEIDETDPVTHLVVTDPVTGDPVKKTVDMTFAEYVNYLLFSSNNFQKIINDNQQWLPDQSKFEPYLKPFSYAKYDILWNIEIAYRVTIKGSVPTESTYAVTLMDESTSSAFRFAKI